jgi:hypothetical protein
MSQKIILSAAAVLLAGCGSLSLPVPFSSPPPPPPAPSAPEPSPSEPLDPFVVMIGAERWEVILDRALEGIALAPDGPAVAETGSDLYRADAALKSGAARLLELRDQVCGKGLLSGEACRIPNWPSWTGEPPTANTPIEEIERRSQWLGEAMQPFTSVGCQVGRQATGEPLFCSVE